MHSVEKQQIHCHHSVVMLEIYPHFKNFSWNQFIVLLIVKQILLPKPDKPDKPEAQNPNPKIVIFSKPDWTRTRSPGTR